MKFFKIGLIILFSLSLVACGDATSTAVPTATVPAATPTVAPPATAVPPTATPVPTATLVPTATPKPTVTPNNTATAAAKVSQATINAQFIATQTAQAVPTSTPTIKPILTVQVDLNCIDLLALRDRPFKEGDTVCVEGIIGADYIIGDVPTLYFKGNESNEKANNVSNLLEIGISSSIYTNLKSIDLVDYLGKFLDHRIRLSGQLTKGTDPIVWSVKLTESSQITIINLESDFKATQAAKQGNPFTPTPVPNVLPTATPVPTATPLPTLPPYYGFMVDVTGTKGLRFAGSCLVLKADGSTSSQDAVGVVPATIKLGDGEIVSCVLQNQGANGQLNVKLVYGNNDFTVSEGSTSQAYGVVSVSGKF